VDHALRVGKRLRHNFQKSPAPVGADDEQPGLAVVVLLDAAQDVGEPVQDVLLSDPMFAGASCDTPALALAESPASRSCAGDAA
jgi:hypothetical protein